MADKDDDLNKSKEDVTKGKTPKKDRRSSEAMPAVVISASPASTKKKDKERESSVTQYEDSDGGNSESSRDAPREPMSRGNEAYPKSHLLKKTAAVDNLKYRARSSSLSAADGSPLTKVTRSESEPVASTPQEVKNSFHKFQPKTTSKPLTCKVCNKFIWGSGGFTCAGCKCAVHIKGCAAKAREERGCAKPLISPFIADEETDRLAGFRETDVFKINMAHQKQKFVIFNPNIILADLLYQIDLEMNLKNHVCFDGEGKPMSDTELTLSKMKATHVYYVPKGMPLAMVPELMGFGQTIQLLNVKSEEARRSNSAAGRRQIQKKTNLKDSAKADDRADKDSAANGSLNISLKHARSLVVSDDFEFVYVVISSANTEQHFRSRMLEFSSNPDWNQTFKVNLNHVDVVELSFKIWATSKNGTSADSIIGQLVLEVRDFADGDSINKIYTIKKEPKKLKGNRSSPGQLRVKWKFLERHFKPLNIGAKSGESDDESGEETPHSSELTTDTERSGQQEGSVALESKSVVVASENITEATGAPTKKRRRKITDIYEFGEELGRGAYSVVKVIYRKDNRQTFACKILDNYSNLEDAENEEQNFQNETSILKKLNHAHICRLYDVFKDRKHYYVVLENVAGGELFDQLVDKGYYLESEAAPLIKQLFSALSHVHELGYCHRDIKPENLLFADDEHSILKIVDFGEAKSTKKGPLEEYVGTPDYMSPEIVKGLPYDEKTDIWSAGVVVYILLFGFPPFDGDNEAEVFINIMNMRYGFPSPECDHVSDLGKDFIRKLMCEPEKRMPAAEAVKHPWILKFAPN